MPSQHKAQQRAEHRVGLQLSRQRLDLAGQGVGRRPHNSIAHGTACCAGQPRADIVAAVAAAGVADVAGVAGAVAGVAPGVTAAARGGARADEDAQGPAQLWRWLLRLLLLLLRLLQ